jgi:ATP-dependent Clp protease ATP-binding subunit ClpA
MVQKLTNMRVGKHADAPACNPYGGSNTAQVFITPRLKRIMDIAYEEAMKLKDEYISTEHMLLALRASATRPAPPCAARGKHHQGAHRRRVSRSATASASPSPPPRANIACWRNMAAT